MQQQKIFCTFTIFLWSLSACVKAVPLVVSEFWQEQEKLIARFKQLAQSNPDLEKTFSGLHWLEVGLRFQKFAATQDTALHETPFSGEMIFVMTKYFSEFPTFSKKNTDETGELAELVSTSSLESKLPQKSFSFNEDESLKSKDVDIISNSFLKEKPQLQRKSSQKTKLIPEPPSAKESDPKAEKNAKKRSLFGKQILRPQKPVESSPPQNQEPKEIKAEKPEGSKTQTNAKKSPPFRNRSMYSGRPSEAKLHPQVDAEEIENATSYEPELSSPPAENSKSPPKLIKNRSLFRSRSTNSPTPSESAKPHIPQTQKIEEKQKEPPTNESKEDSKAANKLKKRSLFRYQAMRPPKSTEPVLSKKLSQDSLLSKIKVESQEKQISQERYPSPEKPRPRIQERKRTPDPTRFKTPDRFFGKIKRFSAPETSEDKVQQTQTPETFVRSHLGFLPETFERELAQKALDLFFQGSDRTSKLGGHTPLLLATPDTPTMGPLVWILGALNQVAFVRFPQKLIQQQTKSEGLTENPTDPKPETGEASYQVFEDLVRQTQWLDIIEHLQSETEANHSIFESLPGLSKKASENLKIFLDLSLDLQKAMLKIAEIRSPASLNMISKVLYWTLFKNIYLFFDTDFRDRAFFIDYLEILAREHVAGRYFFDHTLVAQYIREDDKNGGRRSTIQKDVCKFGSLLELSQPVEAKFPLHAYIERCHARSREWIQDTFTVLRQEMLSKEN